MSSKNMCKDCEWYRDGWCHYEPDEQVKDKESFCSKFELNYVQQDINRKEWDKLTREWGWT